MGPASSLGRVITFYSYKGGTGRTMALANIAYILSQSATGQGILMVDWDLEAPGLHRYFYDLFRAHFPGDQRTNGFDVWPGLIDLIREIADLSADRADRPAAEAFQNFDLDRYILKTDIPGLHLIKAGRFDEAYSAAVNSLRWEEIHARAPWLFAAFGKRLAERYDYVLIDARTGLTDAGGICTSILPDTLVVVFTPNRQSLLGGLDVARSAGNYRKDSDDLRPLRILPLPSRIEAAEPSLRERWRFGDPKEDVPGYQPLFENLFLSLYDLPSCDLADYFSEVQIQHLPRFAYGEEIAARVEPADRLSLTRSFQHFVKRLVSPGAPWEAPLARLDEAAPPPAQDRVWLESQRVAGAAALQKVDIGGFMEASFFLSPPLNPIPSGQLFRAVQAAQVSGTGWPIGAVVETRSESRPRPASDGLSAEIIDKATNSCDYWSLRSDGSFYFVRNLEEETEYLLIDDRVARITELLFYCKRLFRLLETDPKTNVLISVSFFGLAGRALGCRAQDAPEKLLKIAGVCVHNTIRAETVIEVGRIQRDIDNLVDTLTSPLFASFEFYQLPANERQRLVNKSLADWGLA